MRSRRSSALAPQPSTPACPCRRPADRPCRSRQAGSPVPAAAPAWWPAAARARASQSRDPCRRQCRCCGPWRGRWIQHGVPQCQGQIRGMSQPLGDDGRPQREHRRAVYLDARPGNGVCSPAAPNASQAVLSARTVIVATRPADDVAAPPSRGRRSQGTPTVASAFHSTAAQRAANRRGRRRSTWQVTADADK